MIDIREYEQLALDSGAYRDIEIDILKETLLAWQKKPGEPYIILELRDGRVLAGFSVLCRAPNTDFTYDVLAICIDRVYHDKGVGRRLLEMLEEETLRNASSAVLRIEISLRKETAIGTGLLAQSGYSLIGHIADFFGKGDDLFMYARHVTNLPPPEAPPLATIEAAPDAEDDAGIGMNPETLAPPADAPSGSETA